jgi:hypothetical protein
MVNKWIRTSYPEELSLEIERILLDCENQGIFLRSKTEAAKIIAEKSRRYRMPKGDLIDYLREINRREKNEQKR